jgi:hypothetical protein
LAAAQKRVAQLSAVLAAVGGEYEEYLNAPAIDPLKVEEEAIQQQIKILQLQKKIAKQVISIYVSQRGAVCRSLNADNNDYRKRKWRDWREERRLLHEAAAALRCEAARADVVAAAFAVVACRSAASIDRSIDIASSLSTMNLESACRFTLFLLSLTVLLIDFVVDAAADCEAFTVRDCVEPIKLHQLEIQKCLAHLTPKELIESDWFAQIGGNFHSAF